MAKPIEHGTLQGYGAEVRRKLPICPECAVAAKAYRDDPEVRAQRMRASRARHRALVQLSGLYRDDYKMLYRRAYRLDEGPRS